VRRVRVVTGETDSAAVVVEIEPETRRVIRLGG